MIYMVFILFYSEWAHLQLTLIMLSASFHAFCSWWCTFNFPASWHSSCFNQIFSANFFLRLNTWNYCNKLPPTMWRRHGWKKLVTVVPCVNCYWRHSTLHTSKNNLQTKTEKSLLHNNLLVRNNNRFVLFFNEARIEWKWIKILW